MGLYVVIICILLTTEIKLSQLKKIFNFWRTPSRMLELLYCHYAKVLYPVTYCYTSTTIPHEILKSKQLGEYWQVYIINYALIRTGKYCAIAESHEPLFQLVSINMKVVLKLAAAAHTPKMQIVSRENKLRNFSVRKTKEADCMGIIPEPEIV